MTTFNGGTTAFMQFYRNGRVEYTLWYDVGFEIRSEPEVKAAYNGGTWVYDGTMLDISWKGGGTGLFGSDLGEGEAGFDVELMNNVMVWFSEGQSTRFVRCL